MGPSDSPVPCRLRLRTAHVLRARARVVSSDFVARPTTKQLDDGLSCCFAEQIPQGKIDCRTGAALGAGGTEPYIGDQIPRYRVDGQAIASEQVACKIVVYIRLYRRRIEKRLAQVRPVQRLYEHGPKLAAETHQHVLSQFC